MTSDVDLQRMVAESYLSLADLCAGLRPDGWDTASLCAGWRVREVVAHVTMPVRYTPEAFQAELADCGFDFTQLSNRVAERDATLPTDDLVGQLRDPQLHRWVPPGGGPDGALNHAVVHGLDITVPLCERRPAFADALRRVLEQLTGGGGHRHFGTDIAGQRLEATDLDWSYGSGAPLRGPAGALVLHLCGRRLPAGTLTGLPAGR